MKKTLIALMALAGVACGFDNVELTFDGTLADGFTWKTLTDGSTPTYVDSGLKGYGQAIVFDKTGFVTSSGDFTSITKGDNEASFSVVTTLKFDSWAEYGGSENRIYIFGSGDKWKGFGWSVASGTMYITAKGVGHPDPNNPVGVGSLELDTWYTLALTYNTSNDTATFYVDGQSVGSVTVSNDINQPDAGLGIGNGAREWTTGPWAGQMADFKLFNSALTAEQVAAYGAPVAAPSIPEPATATLSLLALAGLAARRRRK